jgi:hypothetical protein
MKSKINVLNEASLSLGFGSLSGPNLASLAANIILAMTGNTYFPATQASIAELQNLLTAYNNLAAAAAGRDHNAVMAKMLSRIALVKNMQALGRYCMSVANGDRQMLESTEFPMNKRGTQPPPEIKWPRNLAVTDGPLPCSVHVSVDGDSMVKSYSFQYTMTDPETKGTVWTSEFSTISDYIFFDLQPGARYWFRVVVIGTRRQIKISDVKSRLVQ